MSIEKMTMVNIVAPIDILDKVVKHVVLSKCFHPVNAIEQINNNNFKISTTEDNIDTIIDVNYVRPYSSREIDYSKLDNKMKELENIIGESYENVDEDLIIFDKNILEEKINEIVSKITHLNDSLKDLEDRKKILVAYNKNLNYLGKLDVNLEELMNLKNFNVNMYKIPKEKFIKLKSNYENVPAIVKRVYKDKEYEVIMVFFTEVLKMETERILSSLNCDKVSLPLDYKGKPKEICCLITKEIEDIEKQIKIIKSEIKQIYNENKNEINIVRKSFNLEKISYKLKEYVAYTRDFFYMFGWVPTRSIKDLKKRFVKYDAQIIIIEKNVSSLDKNIVVPTKLKNNSFIKPFETMVNMYGTPSYGEIDPTIFLAITYMIMFGAMFGDVGQGFILFIMGLYLKYKKDKDVFGNILTRLGVSSIIFGFLYGSIFGFEDILDPILIRPMENISQVLLGAVAFGCILLIMGFALGLVNNLKKGNIEDGLFGKEGLAGMIFYILLLTFAYTKIKSIDTISTMLWLVIFVILLALMVLKQPLANMLKKENHLFNDNKSDYFIEGCFGVIETLLSMFSNTISFIRVGAFALNHVGLFIAFASMAQMMKSGIGSGFMYLLGNVIIIFLEGLIVFIQGLRLEYYELFSKYYDGSGLEFNPIRIVENK